MRRPPRRPRIGLALAWLVAFWVAGARPLPAVLLAGWTVYWALSERPAVGVEWALFGGVLTAFLAALAVTGFT